MCGQFCVKFLHAAHIIPIALAPHFVVIIEGLRTGLTFCVTLTLLFQELQYQVIVLFVLLDDLLHTLGHFQPEADILEVACHQPCEDTPHCFWGFKVVLESLVLLFISEVTIELNDTHTVRRKQRLNSIGGAIPLGYKIEDKKLVIDPKTAPIVKEAFEKYADGETVAEICRQFNARGYKTSKGTAFGKSSFTKIFRNERYIGVYTFHDYRAEDAIPAIIDKDLWDRVQLRVGKIKNAPARNKAKVVYLLSGKIFCGHCGSKMNGNCNVGNYCYYQCYGKKNGNVDCKKKNIRKEFIERLVAQDALSLLTDEYIEQIATIACEKNQHEIELDSALPTIRDRIHQVDLSLNNLLKAIESGSAPDMLVKRIGELEKEKKDLQAQAKKESEDIIELDKAQVIYWLEQFRGGSIEDEEFCRMLIDLFVNSVTVWDED